jgi:hypothetical protein
MAKATKKFDAADSAQDIKPVVPNDSFKANGKAYRFLYPKLDIPGIGIRTSLECLLDNEKHIPLGNMTIGEYLVSIKSGSIEEV